MSKYIIDVSKCFALKKSIISVWHQQQCWGFKIPLPNTLHLSWTCGIWNFFWRCHFKFTYFRINPLRLLYQTKTNQSKQRLISFFDWGILFGKMIWYTNLKQSFLGGFKISTSDNTLSWDERNLKFIKFKLTQASN